MKIWWARKIKNETLKNARQISINFTSVSKYPIIVTYSRASRRFQSVENLVSFCLVRFLVLYDFGTKCLAFRWTIITSTISCNVGNQILSIHNNQYLWMWYTMFLNYETNVLHPKKEHWFITFSFWFDFFCFVVLI